MSSSILIINDPSVYSYEKILSEFIAELPSKSNVVDIFIVSEISSSNLFNLVLSNLYNTIRAKANDLGWDYKLGISVIFNQNLELLDLSAYDSVYSSSDVDVNVDSAKILAYDSTPAKFSANKENLPSNSVGQYGTVACGGTFDHLHDGHKILLSMTLFLASKKVIIGVTGPKLLTKKKYQEVLESYEKREQNVKEFYKHILASASIEFDYYEINDVCGPTGFVRDIDALVVSGESAKGGEFVNNYRSEKSFPILDIITVDVVGKNEEDDDTYEGKLSSTDIRELEYKKLVE
ncbi:phosphopantetheine adenylyltransferase [[Candida] railenensis]|uniref:Phosphopantetheine adenylyltransferase n=1 Tax=[Candida] railenensis TaxID=45579 RepID=A0A9P0QTM9_9ASCO|nr:phosphopantetheine adenylyltransferase [[Candida] railenensis]